MFPNDTCMGEIGRKTVWLQVTCIMLLTWAKKNDIFGVPKNKQKPNYDYYYLKYSDYWPHFYNHNLLADLSYSPLQVFHVKLESPLRISNWTLYLIQRSRLFQFSWPWPSKSVQLWFLELNLQPLDDFTWKQMVYPLHYNCIYLYTSTYIREHIFSNLMLSSLSNGEVLNLMLNLDTTTRRLVWQ